MTQSDTGAINWTTTIGIIDNMSWDPKSRDGTGWLLTNAATATAIMAIAGPPQEFPRGYYQIGGNTNGPAK